MASVTSLGVHQPTGLRYAIEEQILPPDPPLSSYTWEIDVDSRGDQDYEDELLTTSTCVIWSRGGIFRKAFRFDVEKEPITQALLTYFPTSDESNEGPSDTADAADASNTAEADGESTGLLGDRRPLSRALVVFLKTQAHIYFLAGTDHIVHMPFEVEAACAAPCGVIIQRKSKMDNMAPVSLKFPRVPPNSFVSSQPPPSTPHSSQIGAFSTEGLGKPRTLPLRLSSTLENMWQPPLEPSDSHWPRIVCLTDPLQELGLVVTQPNKSKVTGRRKSAARSPFLDPAEEMLHVESIKLPGRATKGNEGDLILAVTVNRETNMYSVWKMTYMPREDIFTARQKDSKHQAARRRSSMPPGLAGSATPLQPNFRESFGAPLPGKKLRRNEKADKTLDTALSSLDPEKGGEVTRRQSRRVSSLLARADLSASQDRSTFADQPIVPDHGRRLNSHGSQRARASAGYGGNFSGAFNHSLNSLAEAPVDNLLDELRAGGDFEGFHSMGLEDHDLDGLAHEILLTKIHSVTMDNTNVRYSMSTRPAREQSKVFVMLGGPCATDEQGRSQLLVGIQDPLDKRLQLLAISVENNKQTAPSAGASTRTENPDDITVSWGQLRRAQSVVDSCKITDGDQSMILILSEDKSGQRELSLQAPWSQLTTVVLPLLFNDNVDSLDYSGRHVNKEVKNRRSIGVGVPGAQIKALWHPTSRGVVDILDREERSHRIRIQLEPKSLQGKGVLDVCRSVLPSPYGERMLACWWHIMQWRKGVEPPATDLEWSSIAILLLASILSLRDPKKAFPVAATTTRTTPLSNWDAMQVYETPNSAASPAWMRTKGWRWLLDEDILEPKATAGDPVSTGTDFISVHVSLAEQFLASPPGQTALGPQGSLATAAGRPSEDQRGAAWSIMLALHFQLEEQKLNIMSSDDLSPGPPDLRALLSHIAQWLGWRGYAALYDLGLQAEPPPTPPELCLNPPLPEPPVKYCIYDWIQAQLTTEQSSQFMTLAEVYAAATCTTTENSPRLPVWESITPRTLMFARLFKLLTPSSTHREIVEAMYECGFTPRVLESLPEAVLTPLQDALFMCQPNPPPTWPKHLLKLVNRTDISSILDPSNRVKTVSFLNPTHHATWDFRVLCHTVDDYTTTGYDEGEGTERQAVVRALFKDDRRLNEGQSLLATNKHRIVRLDAQPGWSESEYLEKQKELATTMATSTLAIPPGRGLLYYGLKFPLLTQKFHIGGLNLTCIVRPTNVTVSVDKALCTEDKINWAFFHQGVAGGLAISPHAKGIDTSWILYNKPGQDLSHRHAGFLLALGLNGHLKSVAKWVAFKYLTPKHTMTSIGLLLGLAASYMGTMDSLITRLLSVHVTRMLPRGAAELNLSKHTQTTGIMGIGLLYCNSQHRRMSEIMMSEIEHVDDEDDEDPLRDEGYRLAAGFALGFINLGKGTDLKGFHDMQLVEKLLTIATSTKGVELVHVLDRSAAGAVVAITLIFMKSEDHIVARKVDVPDSILQFDYVRPDILLLRTVAKNLILWSKIEPEFEWIRNSLPKDHRWRYRLKNVTRLQSKDLPFFCILAGLCFAIALRFAGSANTKVRDVLIHYLDEFMRLSRSPSSSFDVEMARTSVRMCMNLLALSCATVMAGTADLVVLRRLRSLHGRDDATTTYGSHFAAHIAIGALFLGCGTMTFGTSNLAIASLLVAFYPLFPANIQDNRAHLQAFRHFWVLATDPRCLVTKDFATGQPMSVPVLIRLKPDSPSATSRAGPSNAGIPTARTSKDAVPVTLRRKTPCLLPPLEDVASVRTDASAQGYWDLEIDFERRPQLAESFRSNQSLFLRRRPAHDSAFQATLLALGRDALLLPGTAAVEAAPHPSSFSPAARDPLEWVFRLPALRGLAHAERALVLDRLGGGGEASTTVVDARLALEDGMDGWSRDKLLGLRLLFEWADTRSRRLGPLPSRAGVPPNEGSPEIGRTKGKGKGKKTDGRRGKKKAEVEESRDGEGSGVLVQQAGAEGHGWWMRDSVIEMLKGRAWLAGREE